MKTKLQEMYTEGSKEEQIVNLAVGLEMATERINALHAVLASVLAKPSNRDLTQSLAKVVIRLKEDDAEKWDTWIDEYESLLEDAAELRNSCER